MGLSSGVPLDRFIRDAPTRDKVTLVIERRHDELSIHLAVPLRGEVEEEAALITVTGQNAVRVHYKVRCDLDRERAHLTGLVREAYRRGPLGAALRQDTVATLTSEDLRALLLDVANHGDGLHRRLFGFPDDLELRTRRPREFTDEIRLVLRRAFLEPRIVHVAGDAPLFPWNFLYQHTTPLDGLAPATFDVAGFWGFRHEIQHEVEQVATALALPPDPRIVAAVCPAVAVIEPDHPLRRQGTEFVDNVVDLRRQLREFGADCLYFFGHASHAAPPVPDTSKIWLHGVPLSVTTLGQGGGPRFRREPVLVFLNGCGTGDLREWSEDTFIGYLVHRGDHRVCCITSAAEIPIGFADAFAREFWQRFLVAGRPLGAALLATRRALLDAHNNPLGLLYEVIGQVDTHLRSPEENP